MSHSDRKRHRDYDRDRHYERRHDRSDHHRKKSRPRSPSPISPPRQIHPKQDAQVKEETNLSNFSFLNHKHDLNRILKGHYYRDTLVDDTHDFWLFVSRYEALLKRSGKLILPDPIDPDEIKVSSSKGIPTVLHKDHLNCLRLSTPFDTLFSRLHQFDMKGLTEYKVRQFLKIVLQYSDFRQKERFNKLLKLKKTQQNLPVAKYREEIVRAVKDRQIVIVAGDTGCGKSTQVPQYLLRGGFENIACTQPRRIACIALQKRVAFEMLCQYDNTVGYQIRFERSKSAHTKITFITEGLLLRQLSGDEELTYDVLIFDEVHERNLFGDFLLGIVKIMIQSHPHLKVILMSATINLQLFKEFFSEEQASVIEVPGRLYPIKLHYMPQIVDVRVKGQKTSRLDPSPYINIMQLIDKTYPSSEKGDLLIFLSGTNEISIVEEAATQYSEEKKNWIVLPLHSQLSLADQDKVFDYAPEGVRKVIIATNIAETSITIDGIRFVVDSGKVKEMTYDPACRMQRLKEVWISKASAEQRKGRAGRTGPGVCYRLYSDKEYEKLEPFTLAEIHKVPLESVLLQMIAMGLENARKFPFIEPPPRQNVENALNSLKQIDALSGDEKLTALGETLSKIPVDISIGKMLLMGCVFQQLQPVLTLCAALSIQSPFTNRAYRDHECQEARKSLESDHGDPITLLNAFREWLELKQDYFDHKTRESTKHWCKKRGLEEQRFFEITKLRRQFEDLLKDCGLLDLMDTKELSAAERAIRKGEMRQLKQIKKQHRMEAPRKRKVLKHEGFTIQRPDDDEDEGGDGNMDIRDVEFKMSHDASRMQTLLQASTACDYRDLMIIKVILVSGLYPQVAMADEFNGHKPVSEHFYHTKSKPYTSLHPMSYFGNNSEAIQLTAGDIVDQSGAFKSKVPLSSKHQLVCYVTLLETTKPYLMNTFRMPAATTLLLFSHLIETNLTCSRIVCDEWICLDFPSPETGMTLLSKAVEIRQIWNKLISEKLEVLDQKNVDNEMKKIHGILSKLEHKLTQALIAFMNCEVVYTIKRLLPGDLKVLYKGPNLNNDLLEMCAPNPFIEDFELVENNAKGGVLVTSYINYGCLVETDWSLQIMELIQLEPFQCSTCKETFHSVTALQRLQHSKECKKLTELVEVKKETPDPTQIPKEAGTREFKCDVCQETMYLKPIDILRHKKKCQAAA